MAPPQEPKRFRITDPETGRTIVLRSLDGTPPPPDVIADAFDRANQSQEPGVPGRFMRGLTGFANPGEVSETASALGTSVREQGVMGTLGALGGGLMDMSRERIQKASQQGLMPMVGGPLPTPVPTGGPSPAAAAGNMVAGGVPGVGPQVAGLVEEAGASEAPERPVAEMLGIAGSFGLGALPKALAGRTAARAASGVDDVTRLRPGQTGGGISRFVDRVASNFAVTQGRIAQHTTQQVFDVMQGMDRMISEISPSAQRLTRAQFGRAINQRLAQAERGLNKAFSDEYSAIQQAARNLDPEGTISIAPVKDVARELMRELDRKTGILARGQPGPIQEGVSGLKRQLNEVINSSDFGSFEEVHGLRSLLLDIQRSLPDEVLGNVRQRIVGKLTGGVNDAMIRGAREIGGDSFADWVQATGRRYAEAKKSLNTRGMQSLITRNQDQPVQIVRALLNLTTDETDVRTVKRLLFDNLPADRAEQTWSAMRAKWLNEIVTAADQGEELVGATTRVTPSARRQESILSEARSEGQVDRGLLNPKSIRKKLDNPEIRPKLNEFFAPAEIEQIERLLDVSARVLPKSSGAASFISAGISFGLINGAIGAVTGGAPGAIGGFGAGVLGVPVLLELYTRVATKQGGASLLRRFIEHEAAGNTAPLVPLAARLGAITREVVENDPELQRQIAEALESGGPQGTIPFSEVGAQPQGQIPMEQLRQ